MIKSYFITNFALEKGATFVWNKSFYLKDVFYTNNICKDLINTNTYEPDNLAIMIPKSY